MNLQALANRVAHDHMHLAATGDSVMEEGDLPGVDATTRRGRLRQRRLRERRRAKAEEALYLMKECEVPMKRVAKRLRLSLRAVKLLRSIPFSHVEDALLRKVRRVQFEKVHERACECIRAVIAKARSPLYLREI